jgi:hypothetical protein
MFLWTTNCTWVVTANQVAKRENRQYLNTAKVSKHVWTKKKQAVGKLTVEVAKLITSPPLHRVTKRKTRSSVMAPRPDSSSGRSGEVRKAYSKQGLGSCEVSSWRGACLAYRVVLPKINAAVTGSYCWYVLQNVTRTVNLRCHSFFSVLLNEVTITVYVSGSQIGFSGAPGFRSGVSGVPRDENA